MWAIHIVLCTVLTGNIVRALVTRQEHARAVALAFLGSMKVTNLLTGKQDGLVPSLTDTLMPEHTKSRQILTSGQELAKAIEMGT